MSHVAIVKTTSDNTETGRWTFEDYDPDVHKTLSDLPVTGVETDNETDQGLYDDGEVTKFGDFLHLIVGGRGTRDYDWDGEPPVDEAVALSTALADLRKGRTVQKTEPVVNEDAEVTLADGSIAKADEETRNVFGWAYVTHDTEGNVNVDKSGDFIDEVEEIEKSAYDFVLHSRQGDADHTNVKGATLVESMVFTPEKIEKMGLPAGTVPLGWWLGFHVEDDKTWDRVKKGELRAFSIHGKGTRKSVSGDK